jgi:ribosomal protein L25 (general stress protein Ctc)
LYRIVRGSWPVVCYSNDKENDKLALDKQYFDDIRMNLESAMATLEIAMDRKLLNQILAAADTLDEDLRLGKLHSLEEAFAEPSLPSRL